MGFIVSKAVGNAVTRNLVKRRLRAIVAEQLRVADGPLNADTGNAVVIRALPPSAQASWDDLKRDVETGLSKAAAKDKRKRSHHETEVVENNVR